MEVHGGALEGSFSSFGLNYLQQLFNFVIPEGHPLIKDMFLMRWWQVLLISIAYPFILGNLRAYRLEHHTKPIRTFDGLCFCITGFSIVVHAYILYEIIMYYWNEGFFVCHSKNFYYNPASINNNFSDHTYHESLSSYRTYANYPIEVTISQMRMAQVLWYFHVMRFFFDLVNTMQSSLSKSITELKSDHFLNEIRFTLTHFIAWWLTLLYHPGGEVIYPVAVVSLFYLGTVFCAFTIGKFIRLKMAFWIFLVFTNFLRIFVNLMNRCDIPASILLISPPYDINTNIHMMLFYFVSFIPTGTILHYVLYGRGTPCTWWTVFIFLLCAHIPQSHITANTKNSKSKDVLMEFSDVLELSTSNKSSKKQKAKEKKKQQQYQDSVSQQSKNSPPTSSKLHIPAKIFRKCSFFLCPYYETQPKEFKVCERCRAPYCSVECQTKDWKDGNHKPYCKKFLAINL